MTKLFFILFLISVTSLSTFANEGSTPTTKLSFNEAQPLLSSIENEAILIGTGSKIIYVFIDPMCIKSREFIDLISTTPRLQEQYTYKIFLSQLSSRFDSKGLIEAVYQSKNKLNTLIALMSLYTDQNPVITNNTDIEVTEKIDTIEHVSYKLKAFKRPYIFISTEQKAI